MYQALSFVPSIGTELAVSSLVLNGELNGALEFKIQNCLSTRPLRIGQAAKGMTFKHIPTYEPIHMAGREGFRDFVFIPGTTSAR